VTYRVHVRSVSQEFKRTAAEHCHRSAPASRLLHRRLCRDFSFDVSVPLGLARAPFFYAEPRVVAPPASAVMAGSGITIKGEGGTGLAPLESLVEERSGSPRGPGSSRTAEEIDTMAKREESVQTL